MKQSKINLLITLAGMLIVISCEKDDNFNNKANENLPSTAIWTYIDGSGFSTNGTTYVKGKEIEENTSHVDIRVNVTKAGTYNISTETINGYKFSGIGELVVKEESEYQAITLWASGTPISSGSFDFELTAGGTSSTFKTKVVPLDANDLASKIVISATYPSIPQVQCH